MMCLAHVNMVDRLLCSGIEVPWHQDGRYWPIHPPASCSVWVAIDEADEANGAMGWCVFDMKMMILQ